MFDSSKTFPGYRARVSVLVLLSAFGVTRVHAQPYAYVAQGCLNGMLPCAGTVSVINAATNTVVDTITAGQGPSWVAITPDGTRAYVTNYTDDTVSVINTATSTVMATVPVGNGPAFGVAITPDGTRAYVTNQLSNNVFVIDTATNAVVATVPAGAETRGIAITPD